MIRDSVKSDSSDGASFSTMSSRWLWGFAVLALGATIAAAWQGQALGMPAFLLLIGVSIVSVIGILTIVLSPKLRQDEAASILSSDEVLGASFFALRQPSLIMRNGKPVYANRAYFDLADSLGVTSIDDEPPSADLLFSKKEKTASAALFRLHHTNQLDDMSEETIRTLDVDGTYRVFSVRVSTLKSGQLWQIEEILETGANSSPMIVEAPVGLFSIKPDGTVLEMNNVLRGWLGVDAVSTPENMSEFIENPGVLLESEQTPGRTIRGDTRLITTKGVVSPTVMSGVWQQVDSSDIIASVAVYGHSGVGMQRQSLKLAQEQMIDPDLPVNTPRRRADDLRLHVHSEAPFGVVQLDSTDLNAANVVNSNTGFLSMVDMDDVAGVSFASLFEPNQETEQFLSAGLQIQDVQIDVWLQGKKKCPVNVYFSSPTDTGCMAYIVDISARKELEHQLIQSQKMQAIGQLAGGVAHDFNNLLTAIRLNTDDLLGRHPVGDPSYPELQKINQTVARAAGLVRKLLAFSRKQTMRAQTLDVTETLSDLSVLLNQVMIAKVKLEVFHGRDLPSIQADKGQLETVLMNLCVNARDAMDEKGSGGTIILRSAKASDEDLEKDGIKPRAEGGYVLITVSDTGTGMDADTQKKIFEPFFTTKEQGKGTGLGLATVYGIVEQSGGHLRVDSTPDVGTTFKVYIPTSTEKDKQIAPARKIPIAVKPADLSGQGNILFVEDEAAVRTISAKTLRKRGYTVTEAGDGEEAYEILEDATEPFDLMISDVVMPGMDGPTLLKQGRTLLGDARIVFISGYAEEEFSDLLAEEPDVTFLPKPFTLTQLLEKVKSVIGEPV